MMRVIVIWCFLLTSSLISGLPHLCLDSASWNQTSGLCVCPPKQVGDGDLCCAGNGFDMCTVKGDPLLKSISGAEAFTDLPCTTRLSTIKEVIDGNTCDINVFSAGKFVDKGFVLHHALSIEISINGAPSKFLKFMDGNFKDPINGEIIDSSRPHIFTVGDVGFEVSFASKDKLWKVSGCNMQIKFRNPEGTDPIQDRPSGICVLTRPGTSQGGVIDGNICNLDASFDKGLYFSVGSRLLANAMIVYDGLRDEQKLETPQTLPQCDNLVTYFQDCNTIQKPKALMTCGKILLNPVVRRCLSVEKANIFLAFCDCIGSFCSRDRNSCERLKTNPGVAFCAKNVMECDSWVSGFGLNIGLGVGLG